MPGITGCARSTAISAEGYSRVRLGIGHPGHKDAVSGYVLQRFCQGGPGLAGRSAARRLDGAPSLAGGRSGAVHERGSLRTAPARSSKWRAAAAPCRAATGSAPKPEAGARTAPAAKAAPTAPLQHTARGAAVAGDGGRPEACSKTLPQRAGRHAGPLLGRSGHRLFPRRCIATPAPRIAAATPSAR